MVSVDVKHHVYWAVEGQIGKHNSCRPDPCQVFIVSKSSICCVFISALAYDEDLARVWAKAIVSSTCLLIQRRSDFRWGSLWSIIIYVYDRYIA